MNTHTIKILNNTNLFLVKKSPKKGTIRTGTDFPKGAFFWRLFYKIVPFLQYFSLFQISYNLHIYDDK